jgi:GT2 family glycosyltransferase
LPVAPHSALAVSRSVNPQFQHPLPSCLVLMVTRDRLEYTKLSLESLLAQDYPNLRIVVFDNGSSDGNREFLAQRLRDEPRARLILSPLNRGVVYPMNEVWFGDSAMLPEAGGAELLAKVDNDTLVPPDLLVRLAEGHLAGDRFGALAGFHFREEGAALIDDSRIDEIDGVRVVRQRFVGGCAVMVKTSTLHRLGPIPCRSEGQNGLFMDGGWTAYQERMTAAGLVSGYVWPLVHVDHMEDVRSPHCIRTAEHQAYKRDLRDMSLEEFTQELCVWRPHWEGDDGKRGGGEEGNAGKGEEGNRGGGENTEAFGLRSQDQRAKTQVQRPTNDNGRMTTDKRRMHFTQDFVRDFDQFDFHGAPFAFTRFADGERAICMGRPIDGADGWRYAGGSSPLQEALLAALRFNDPDYYVGISDGCCDPEAKAWYLREIRVPLSQVTFSNIFVNGNYSRFRQLDLSDAAVVASEGGDHWVPADVWNTRFDIDHLVERLLGVKRPILVSAGPASCVIIHRYWQRATPDQRQVIVDIGSAIDERTKGRKTRQYQIPGTRTAELVCAW